MAAVALIHQQVYELLLQERQKDPSLRFTFRRSNRGGRLEQGYWFYGNEYYVTLSFWSGMDWKNKTPNIVFTILAADGESYLEVNTSDSDDKRRFVSQFLVGPLGLSLIGVRYRKKYLEWGQDYLGTLRHFIETDKRFIDDILMSNTSFWQTDQDAIGFISENEFQEKFEKVLAYQRHPDEILEPVPHDDLLLERVAEFQIDHYGPIHTLRIEELPFATPWIFFTGENGTGKTSILRALATAICRRKINLDEQHPDGQFRVSISLFNGLERKRTFEWKGLEEVDSAISLTVGFAAYGASRLRTPRKKNGDESVNSDVEHSPYDSLFDYDTYLLGLQEAFDDWRADPQMTGIFERRKDFILEILTDVFPHLYSIDFDAIEDGEVFTAYRERDSEGGPFREIRFDQLASGLKSLIGMIGDILIRLYSQQPEVLDPAEFKGIVLIDEIDIHLHPKLQKELVQQLTRTFPRIQFIATTHSPIPLLGAPKGSCIFKVERNSINGVTVQRLDDKLILGNLLPNTILTSPIFGLDDIVPNSHDGNNNVRTEVTYKDVEFNDEVKRKINNFLTDEKEQQLIDRFKQRMS
jgi:predicted ATPase